MVVSGVLKSPCASSQTMPGSSKAEKARIAVPGEHDHRAIVVRYRSGQLGIDTRDTAFTFHHHTGLLKRFENDQRAAADLDRAASQMVGDGDHRQVLLSNSTNRPAITRQAVAPVKPTSVKCCPR
jgi:hypothetical protein